MQETVCPYCNTKFLKTRSDKVYCSRSCKNKSHTRQVRAKNNEAYKEDMRLYREKNRQKLKDYKNAWRLKNIDRWRAYWRNFRYKLKSEVLRHYGGEVPACVCCGENLIEFLTLDHVDGDGAVMRRSLVIKGALTNSARKAGAGGWPFYQWLRKNDYPEEIKLQVMCWNCNCAKGFFGICPHKQPPLRVERVGEMYKKAVPIIPQIG